MRGLRMSAAYSVQIVIIMTMIRVVSLEISGNFLRKISGNYQKFIPIFPEKISFPENFRKFLLKIQYKPSK